MADDEGCPAVPTGPAVRATGDKPPLGDNDRAHDQDRDGAPEDAAEKADDEQERQLAEGMESPG